MALLVRQRRSPLCSLATGADAGAETKAGTNELAAICDARRLLAAGLTLKRAHDAINKLAELNWSVCAVDGTEDLHLLASDLAAMNVELRRKLPVSGSDVDIAEMRGRRGLSQREYAELLGLDVRTLQNWEQGRKRPDPAAVSLMRVFDRVPDMVGEMLTGPHPPADR